MTPLYVALFVLAGVIGTAYAISSPYSAVRKFILGGFIAGMVTLVGTLINLIFYAIAALLLAYPVLLVWNETMIDLFGVKGLNFGHSWGLCFLCLILIRGGSTTTKSDD